MAPVTKPTKSSSPSLLTGVKKSALYIVIVVVLVLACFGAYTLAKTTTVAPPLQQACTMEAKICPDGSAVGRSGPMCEFDPCPPGEEEQTTETSMLAEDSGAVLKRLFDPTGTVIEDAAFPEEMTAAPESALVGLQCSGYYYNDGNGKFVIESPDGSQALADPQLLTVVSEDPTISAISSCRTETGTAIVHYEIHGGGGGTENVAYFDVVSDTGALKQIAEIPNDGAPYFGCRYPYMVTRGNLMYWGCGGGDGGFGQASIYAINLDKGTVRRILKCTSTADSSAAEPVGTSTVKCE